MTALLQIESTVLLVLLMSISVLLHKDIRRSECSGEICADGWTRFNGSCYYVGYEQHLSFIEAEHFCRQHNAHLIHINSKLEGSFIKDFLRKPQAPNTWIGLQDMDIEGVWRWYDDNSIVSYTDWYPGEPGGSVGEDCAMIHVVNYLWQDFPCDRLFSPLCEKNLSQEFIGIFG